MKLCISDDKYIYYNVSGHGPVVVFIHGFIESSKMWKPVTEKTLPGFQILTIDLPGHGKSNSLDSDHGLNFMSEAIKAVFDELKIEQAIFVGHSMGGYVSLNFAHQYPEKVKGIVLLHSHAAADSDEARSNRNRTIEIIKASKKDFIASFIPDLFATDQVKRLQPQIEELISEAREMEEAGIVEALKGMRDRKDSLQLLADAKFPMLFIAGKQDKRIPVSNILQQAALPKHAELLILENVGHMGLLEAQKIVIPALRSFIERTYNLLNEAE